ncbi:type II toxin-antitoxin system HipA family toxin [Coraliomargarita sp. SDUM461004]|uniref:Type II toxin-antitoxin system HipA family toxin n=1 Tax=Thalassobacterium sedimentorum TaxID=3041258 RepID=A0ABU1ARR4_9BACT|nr:type II toxin-antitoxin system HipA family toxin [Coraliomargarita sp. SDUM461004]MDQ8196298.1 type II toxin-antitoxin system HipA family toxin [Coraliomargarita sp. SDUM461004]
MDSLRLFVGQVLAGELRRDVEGIRFCYSDGYVGPPVFLNWPVNGAMYHWSALPAELSCLLPEGLQQAQWRASKAADTSDWGLLAAVGADLPGLISALPSRSKSLPLGREAEGAKSLSRARIRPQLNALPYVESELVEFNSTVGFAYSLASRGANASAVYSRKKASFELVSTNGSYRLTLEPPESAEQVENQLLTALLAQDAGLPVVTMGRVQTMDGRAVLWAERFDRSGASNCQRIRVESACQLLGQPTMAKYEGSVEVLAELIRQYCTSPKIQLMRLFHRVLFGWLAGDSGLHLKKWAFVQNARLIELSPAYGMMNYAIFGQDCVESALSINGRHEGLDRGSLLDYFAKEVCGLNTRIIDRVLNQLDAVCWEQRILSSGLSKASQQTYFERLSERWRRLQGR